MRLADPRYLTFDAWAALAFDELSSDGCSLPAGEAEWQRWAAEVIAQPSLGRFEPLPRPEHFDHWSEWALRMHEAVNFELES